MAMYGIRNFIVGGPGGLGGPRGLAQQIRAYLGQIYSPLAKKHRMRLDVNVSLTKHGAGFTVTMKAVLATQVGKLDMAGALTGGDVLTLEQEFLGPIVGTQDMHLISEGKASTRWRKLALNATITSPALDTTILNQGDLVIIEGTMERPRKFLSI